MCPNSLIIRTNFFWWGPVYRKSFSDWIIESLCKNIKINLFKNVFYTPITIPYLIDLIELLVNLDSNGIFNICSNERISKYEFGNLIAKKFELDISLIEPTNISFENLIIRPLDMSLSNKKLKKEIGKDLIPLQQQIDNLYQSKFTNQFEQIKNFF